MRDLSFSSVFVGIILFLVLLMCSYIVYPSFLLIGVVGAMSLVITLPGASRSKAQMVVLHGRVVAIVLVKLEVTQHS